MNNTKNFSQILLHRVLPIVLGIIVGYFIYSCFLMERLPYFSTSKSEYFVSILCLAGSIVGCTVIFELIINRAISYFLFFLLCVLYFAMFLIVLFMRYPLPERVFVFNPLTGLFDAFSGRQMLIQSLLNLLVFIPIGFFVKKLPYLKLLLFSVCLSLLIEVIQIVFRLGFFDSFDILLYVIGIHLGYLIFQKLKLPIQKRNMRSSPK